MKTNNFKHLLASLVAVLVSVSASAETYSGTCGTNVNWVLDTSSGILSITGTGAMEDYPSSNSNIPWYSYKSIIKTITINSGVTHIGNVAFFNFSSLTSVTIPSSVTSIGENSFGYCTSLTSLTIPSSVTSIGSCAFIGCKGFTSIPTLPSSVTSIEPSTFSICTGLTSVAIPSSVTSIGDYAFSSCYGLTSVTIPSSVTSIGNHAFEGCSKLPSVTIPSSVTNIGNFAFENCKLSSVTIPSSVTSIGEQAFSYCRSLSSINVAVENTVYDSRDNCNAIIETATNTLIQACSNTIIPNTVTSIGNYAFSSCSLTSVIIPSSVTNIGNYAFLGCSSLTSVVIDNEDPFVFGNDAFFAISSDCVLTVPYGTKSAYIAAGWTTDVFKGGIVEAPKINLDDGQAYSFATDIELERITYSRTYKNTNWQAWYVPFDVTLTGDVLAQFSFAKFAGTYTEDDGTFFISVARMREGDVVKANTPYLVQAKTAGTEAQVLTLTDATLYAAQEKGFSMNSAEKTVTIQGIYNTKTATDEDHDWYAFGGGKYIKASVGQALSPYRFYMTITEREDNPYASTPNPTEVKIKVLGEDETGVAPLSVSPEEEKTAVYDLSGRRIEKEKATNGIYIINGKKIFVR